MNETLAISFCAETTGQFNMTGLTLQVAPTDDSFLLAYLETRKYLSKNYLNSAWSPICLMLKDHVNKLLLEFSGWFSNTMSRLGSRLTETSLKHTLMFHSYCPTLSMG